MATVTFQQLITNFPQGAVTISFFPSFEPNPVFGPYSGLSPNVPVSLGGVQRTFMSPAVVSLSVELPNGMRVNQNSQLTPTPGPRSLVFPILRSNYILIVNVS